MTKAVRSAARQGGAAGVELPLYPLVPAIPLVERARQEIQRRIIHLEMAPGETFTEGDLAASLGMSKTPIREALSLLSMDGYVAVAPRIGYRVAPVTLRDVQDLFELRELLEVEATAMAARRPLPRPDADELQRLAAVTADDPSAFLTANTEFHSHIARCSGNARLAQMVVQVLLQHERLFRLTVRLSERSDEMVHEHTDLVAALVAGDADAARDCVVDQLRNAQSFVFGALMSSESVLDARIAVDEPMRLIHARRPDARHDAQRSAGSAATAG